MGPEFTITPNYATDFTAHGHYCLPNCPTNTWGSRGCGLALLRMLLTSQCTSFEEAQNHLRLGTAHTTKFTEDKNSARVECMKQRTLFQRGDNGYLEIQRVILPTE